MPSRFSVLCSSFLGDGVFGCTLKLDGYSSEKSTYYAILELWFSTVSSSVGLVHGKVRGLTVEFL